MNGPGYQYRGRFLAEDTQETIDNYIENGIPTGDFLRAVINNDLREACGRADDHNMWIIPVIVAYLYNECPAGCWGRSDSWERWIEEKRRERQS